MYKLKLENKLQAILLIRGGGCHSEFELSALMELFVILTVRFFSRALKLTVLSFSAQNVDSLFLVFA